jgi:hypothetical protein
LDVLSHAHLDPFSLLVIILDPAIAEFSASMEGIQKKASESVN